MTHNNIKTKKIVLTGISIICSVVMILGFVLAASYPLSLFGNDAKSYEDSDDYGNTIYSFAYNLTKLANNPYFQLDGSYDSETEVSLSDFVFGEQNLTNMYEETDFKYEVINLSPLSYKLGDLVSWAKLSENSNIYNSKKNIIVCQKIDGYDYFTYEEFQQKILSKELQFDISSSQSSVRTEDLLLGLYDSNYTNDRMLASETDVKGIKDKDGKKVYFDCWNYDGFSLDETYAPIGYSSLADFVNKTEDWNGKLSKAYDLLEAALNTMAINQEMLGSLSDVYTADASNISYLYINKEADKITSNRSDWSRNSKNISVLLKEISREGKDKSYLIINGLGDLDTNIRTFTKDNSYSIPTEGATLAILVDTAYPVADSMSELHNFYETYRPFTMNMIYAAAAASIILLVCLIGLTLLAGRKDGDPDLHLMKWDHWFTEVSAAGVFALWAIPAFLFAEGVELGCSLYDYYQYSDGLIHSTHIVSSEDLKFHLACYGILGAFTMIMFLLGYLSLVRRIKNKSFWKDSLSKKLWDFSKTLFKNLNLLWKLIVVAILYLLVLLLGFAGYDSPLVLLPFIGALLIFAYLVKFSIGQQKLLDEIELIAGGDINRKIDTKSLTGIQKNQAEAISHISEGLGIAIENNLRSERMKTELITNVSHDLKTPLTSIINYIDLLKKENLENENAQKYLAVLEQKSQQLKNLTEDVVEASKASSGNITLEKINLNVVELLLQCAGEYSEKFYEKDLHLIERYPDTSVIINADGRRLWRIFSNLYSNVAKYALTGSRVYADLTADDGQMIFTMKNISEHALNITANELTERFVRGDISRTTEGSGLGLSIAQSLTEIQGGSFDIYLDGDLFKVTITFPLVTV